MDRWISSDDLEVLIARYNNSPFTFVELEALPEPTTESKGILELIEPHLIPTEHDHHADHNDNKGAHEQLQRQLHLHRELARESRLLSPVTFVEKNNYIDESNTFLPRGNNDNNWNDFTTTEHQTQEKDEEEEKLPKASSQPPKPSRMYTPRSKLSPEQLEMLRNKNRDERHRSDAKKKVKFERVLEEMKLTEHELCSTEKANRLKEKEILEMAWDERSISLFGYAYREKRKEVESRLMVVKCEDVEFMEARKKYEDARERFETMDKDYADKNSKTTLLTRGSRKSRAKQNLRHCEAVKRAIELRIELKVENELNEWLEQVIFEMQKKIPDSEKLVIVKL